MEEIRFAFGANWQRFVESSLTDDSIRSATESLRRMLKAVDLKGRTFLDVGCGSGLFSLAACLLGIDQVVAFDYDHDSVRASLTLREKSGVPAERWQIMEGSILDSQFLTACKPADVVYSWGVLHHTGAMWQAMDNAVDKVRPGGLLTIAVYNKVEKRVGGSSMWWHIKRAYNCSPVPIRRLLEGAYAGVLLVRRAAGLRNPFTLIRNYGKIVGRGMNFWRDVRDWLGGFPYEYATAAEVFTYLHEKHGLELIYLNTQNGYGCNEFTFRRPVCPRD